MVKTVLMVAEKPSLAQSIAVILSNGQCQKRQGALAIFDWAGDFKGEKVNFKMTAVTGHVLSIDFLPAFNNWELTKPEELFEAGTRKQENDNKIGKHLVSEGKKCDYLVLWLDCDREGENICFEVISFVKKVMAQPDDRFIYRAKFSAITASEIKKAMATLDRPNKYESLSVDARQELDLRIGCAFTRFQTRYFSGKYGDLDSSCVSYGPCQTPTLAFCVERHDKIQTFEPEKYNNLSALLDCGREVRLEWERGRCFDRNLCLVFLDKCQRVSKAKVVSVTKKEKAKSRPTGLNTVDMLKAASSSMGISPQDCMRIAERLYMQGYISYPRTETTHFDKSFNFVNALKPFQKHGVWGEYVTGLLAKGLNSPKAGHDAGDHPPITPMELAYENELGYDEWRLYRFITATFIAAVSYDCKYYKTHVTFDINGETFKCSGKTMKSPGFTEVATWLSITEEEIPDFTENQMCDISEVVMKDLYTSPPGYLTESELISLMEKHGIGTDASIAVHISNICQRNYVKVEGSNRQLVPTNLGIVLIHGYQRIDPDLCLPTMRSGIEKQLNLIAHNKADFNEVLQHAIEIFAKKFAYFVRKIENMDSLFEATFSKLEDSGTMFSRCGKCRRFMTLIRKKPQRLHCSTCDETYSLPYQGTIKLYQELKCPLDRFELLLVTTGSTGRSYVVCPYCYNIPPFEGMEKSMGCNFCTHPKCPHSMVATSVCPCLECENTMILDVTSGPKWKMVCNKCNFRITFFEGARSVKVSEDMCECGSMELIVNFHRDKSPLKDGTEAQGCCFCNEIFIPFIKEGHARNLARKPGKGRGRGRGRGRGGKGRGRGRGRGG